MWQTMLCCLATLCSAIAFSSPSCSVCPCFHTLHVLKGMFHWVKLASRQEEQLSLTQIGNCLTDRRLLVLPIHLVISACSFLQRGILCVLCGGPQCGSKNFACTREPEPGLTWALIRCKEASFLGTCAGQVIWWVATVGLCCGVGWMVWCGVLLWFGWLEFGLGCRAVPHLASGLVGLG